MRLILDKNQLDANPEVFLKRTGYAFIRDRKTGHESFVRRLGEGFYPRLHMYVDDNGDKIVLNLHLDQKQASYEGSRMHSGEHDGPVVEKEIERLKSFLPQNNQESINNDPEKDILTNIGGDRDYMSAGKKEKKQSWWRRFF